jgi:hypothetical protein
VGSGIDLELNTVGVRNRFGVSWPEGEDVTRTMLAILE